MAQSITVGLELECLQVTPECSRIIEKHGFGTRTDSSIKDKFGHDLPKVGRGAAVELVTPIYEVGVKVNQPSIVLFEPQINRVDSIVADLCHCAQQINSTCSTHVHLGLPNGERTDWNPRRLRGIDGGPASTWKPGQVRTMLMLGLCLEEKLYSCVPLTRKQSWYSKSIKNVYSDEDIQAYYPTGVLKAKKPDNPKRYCWLNLIETRRPADPLEDRIGYVRSKAFGTIEIRMMGETTNVDYIQTWVRLWLKIAAAVAYLPAEVCAIKCLHSSWLNPDFAALSEFKNTHERLVAPTCRSVLAQPPSATTNGDD